MNKIWDAAQAVKSTSGAQQKSWMAQLKRLLIADIHRYVDAATACPFSSHDMAEQLQNVKTAIDLVLNLIPEGEPKRTA